MNHHPRPKARFRAVIPILAGALVLSLAALPLAPAEAASRSRSSGGESSQTHDSAADRVQGSGSADGLAPRSMLVSRSWLGLILEILQRIFDADRARDHKPTEPLSPLEMDNGRGSLLDPSG